MLFQVLPPCAPPEMVMPVGSTAGAGSAGSAVSARNGSEEAAPTEAEKASCSGGGAEGESLEDISSFIQETSAKGTCVHIKFVKGMFP